MPEEDGTTKTLIETGMMFSKYFKKFQNRNKTSMLKADALDFLLKHEHSTMTELTTYLNSTQPAVTVLTKVMLAKGLIEGDLDVKDKRKFRFTVTKNGIDELIRIRKLMGEELLKIFEILTVEEKKGYIKIQQKLIIKMQSLLDYDSVSVK